MLKSTDTLIFIHIPKTAGSTMNAIFELYFGEDETYKVSGMANPSGKYDHFQGLSAGERERIRWLTGHIGFGWHDYFSQPTHYCTILRDPIERILSNFYFDGSQPFSPFYEVIQSGEMDLRGYVTHFEAFHSDNLQTRMIAGNWHQKGEGVCDEGMLGVAKRNIEERGLAVGLTERFDEFYLLLCRQLGWRWRLHIDHNVSAKRPRRESLSADDLAFLEEACRYDLALYAFVGEKCRHKIQSLGFRFQAELAMYRLINGLNRTYWAFRKVSVRTWLKEKRIRSE